MSFFTRLRAASARHTAKQRPSCRTIVRSLRRRLIHCFAPLVFQNKRQGANSLSHWSHISSDYVIPSQGLISPSRCSTGKKSKKNVLISIERPVPEPVARRCG